MLIAVGVMILAAIGYADKSEHNPPPCKLYKIQTVATAATCKYGSKNIAGKLAFMPI